MALIILAAGLSTRYRRLKQLDPVGPSGEALMDYGVHDAWRAGVRRVVVVVRRETERDILTHVRELAGEAMDIVSVQQRVDDLPAGYEALAERTKPLGTAHALWCCRHAVGTDPFIMMNADDFYGRSSFERLVAWAGAAPANRMALVPYRLDAVLSETGGVSRAICRIDDSGRLRSIDEVLDIRRTKDDASALFGRSVDGEPVRLTGDELCSMNLWGFTAAVHTAIERGLVDFLGRNRTSPDAEYRVPDMVRSGLETGHVAVRVLETGTGHLGMTHPEDRDAVVSALERLVAEGSYPRTLSRGFR